MSDPVIFALLVKTMLAALLIVGGIAALFIGRGVYIHGVGLSPDGTTVAVKNIKASLKTVGAVVMATSVAWGGLGYLAAPTLSRNQSGETKVASSTPALEIHAPEVVASPSTSAVPAASLLTGADMAKAFREASSTTPPAVKINDAVSPVDVASLKTVAGPDGKPRIEGQAHGPNGSVAVTYKAIDRNNALVFVPENLQVIAKQFDR